MTITINNQTFELTDDQIGKLKNALGFNNKQLSDVAVGETFTVAGIEFIKFPEVNGMVPVVTKDILFSAVFDENKNNFSTSSLLRQLKNVTLPKIESAIGADNVLEFETDLTALDGLDTYGTMKSKISLPTFDFYRKNVRIFDKHKVNKWWWLATPESTEEHDWTTAVLCVFSDGTLCDKYCGSSRGVRPFLCFKSSIFVS